MVNKVVDHDVAINKNTKYLAPKARDSNLNSCMQFAFDCLPQRAKLEICFSNVYKTSTIVENNSGAKL